METYSRYNVAVILFAAFGSLLSGYGLAVIIATVGQPTFYSSLGLEADPTLPGYSYTNTIIATSNGIFFAGAFFGSLFIFKAGSTISRIQGFRIACVVAIVGGAIQTGATHPAMYIVARLITGLATGMTFAALPVYYTEVAPPHSRGFMSGAHGCFINVGYAVANWIGYGCYFGSQSSFAWRFPNAVFILWALCLLAGTFLIPESPRWLVGRDRDDEALKILCRLHQDPNDPHNTFARQELSLIKKQIAEDKKQLREGGPYQLVTMKTYRTRLILAIMIVVGTQNTGILVINNYNALLYSSLGLSNSNALVLSAGYNTWAMLANFAGAPCSDRVGRRKLMLIGFISNTIMLSVATALLAQYSEFPTRKWAALSVTFLFLYVFCYAFFIDVNCWTIAAEIFPSHLRSQGTGIAISSLMLTDILWLQLAPTASSSIGWKYYLVFVALSAAHSVHLWFKLPETSGLALEEIDALFGKEPAGRVDETDVGSSDDKKIETSVIEKTA